MQVKSISSYVFPSSKCQVNNLLSRSQNEADTLNKICTLTTVIVSVKNTDLFIFSSLNKTFIIWDASIEVNLN